MQARTHFHRSVLFFHQGHYQQALQCLQECIRLAPHLSIAHSNFSVVLLNMGKLQEAMLSMKQALQANPTNYIFYFNSFSMQLRQGQSSEALNCIREAISAEYTVLGSLTQDKSMLQKALKLCPNNVEAGLALAMMLVNGGQYQDALACLAPLQAQNSALLQTLARMITIMQVSHTDEVEEEFYQTIEIAQIHKQVLVSTNEITLAELDTQKAIIKAVSEFNTLYEAISKHQGHKMHYLEAKPNSQKVKFESKTQSSPLFFRELVMA